MKYLIKLLIRFYQILISPLIHMIGGPNSGCRFDPTCSEYGIQAFKNHSLIRALALLTKRVFRCHPFNSGGADPLPKP